MKEFAPFKSRFFLLRIVSFWKGLIIHESKHDIPEIVPLMTKHGDITKHFNLFINMKMNCGNIFLAVLMVLVCR